MFTFSGPGLTAPYKGLASPFLSGFPAPPYSPAFVLGLTRSGSSNPLVLKSNGLQPGRDFQSGPDGDPSWDHFVILSWLFAFGGCDEGQRGCQDCQ